MVIYKKENEEIKKIEFLESAYILDETEIENLKENLKDGSEKNEILIYEKNKNVETDLKICSVALNKKVDESLIKKEILKDQKLINYSKLIYPFIAYIALIVISIMKGSDHMKSIIDVKR